MKTSKLLALSGTLALATLLSAGCSSVQKGTAAGGVLGAVTGAAIGNNSASISVAHGAFVGGGAGAATGGLAGDAYEQLTKDDVEREIENLRAELEAKEAELAMLRDSGASAETLAELDRLRGELDNSMTELSDLRSQLSDKDATLAALNSDLDSANAKLSQKDSTLADAKVELLQSKAQVDAKDMALKDLKDKFAGLTTERDNALQKAADFETQLLAAEGQLAKARDEMNVIRTSLNEREQAVNALRDQLANLNIELEETSRGLTLTIVDQLIFKPGKAELSSQGEQVLAQVADIINTNFPNRELLVEGHTDNQPIVKSGWRSNWELGAGRALEVVHNLVDAHGFDPAKLSATTYGEHRPASTNATKDGRSANRRSVIVILPEKMPLQRNQLAGL